MAEGFVLHGLSEFGAAVDAMVARAVIATRGAVGEAALAIERAAMEEAPVVTGTLRRSMTIDGPHADGPAAFTASVGPTAVYGRRVELGFRGSDALGRVFDSAGNPYFGRGFERAASPDRLTEIHASAWARALKAR